MFVAGNDLVHVLGFASATHATMGFHDGWGTTSAQLEDYAKTLTSTLGTALADRSLRERLDDRFSLALIGPFSDEQDYMDLLSLWQAGIRNAVAVSGTALTKEHVHILSRFARKAYLFLDGDAAEHGEEGLDPAAGFLITAGGAR